MFSIFEIGLQDANLEIVNVVTICIEMQWQMKRLFLSDRVCVIIKSVSEISAYIYIYSIVFFIFVYRYFESTLLSFLLQTPVEIGPSNASPG